MGIDFKKLNVLIVADVIPLKKQLVSVFDALNTAAIITSAHAKKGYELFCAHKPDLVIADFDMLPMSGIELTREIRHNSLSPNCNTPVILLTANITAKQAADARAAGVSGLVLRPFSNNDLIKHVTHVMNESRDFIDGPAIRKSVGGPQTKESER